MPNFSKTYYIFRHGQTQAVKNNLPYGLSIYSAMILEEGKPVVTAIGKYLKQFPVDFFVSSPFKRCVQTSEIISGLLELPYETDKRLEENVFELFGSFRKRVSSFISDMERSDHQHIAICTHGAVISALSHLLTHREYEKKFIGDYPKPGVLLIIEGNNVQTIDFN